MALLLITEARCRSAEIYPVPCAGDASTNGTAFRTAVETALNNSEIALGSCTYQVGDTMRDSYNTGILISGKTGLTIRGNGQGQTIVTFTRKVYIGFEIRSNTRNLTIKDMTIAGSVLSPLCQENGFDDGVQCYTSADGSRPATHGVASTGGQTGIDGVVLTNLELKDLAVGISVGSELAGRCVANTYLNATVSNNYIHDMRGKYGGSGYGIHSACAQDVVIRKNTIARAQRHSIYQGKTPPINDKPIRIVSNVIIVPGHGPELYGPNVAALAMARSTNVTAVDNKIVGGHTFGVSAEWDPVTQMDCINCLAIGNRFVNNHDTSLADVWVNAHSPVWVWHNTRGPGTAANLKDETGNAYDVAEPGDFWGYGLGTQAISAMHDAQTGQDFVYVMRNNVLHRVVPDWGKDPHIYWRTYWYSTTTWFDFFDLTADDGQVYLLQHGVLHSVTPASANVQWPSTQSPNWFHPSGLASQGNGYLYVIQNGLMHRVKPLDWSSIVDTATGWSNPQGMATASGLVYAQNGTSTYEVTPGPDRTAWARTVLQ